MPSGKRDTLPIAKNVTKNVLAIINSDNSYDDKKKNVDPVSRQGDDRYQARQDIPDHADVRDQDQLPAEL